SAERSASARPTFSYSGTTAHARRQDHLALSSPEISRAVAALRDRRWPEPEFGGAFSALLSQDGRAVVYGPGNEDRRGSYPVLEAVALVEAIPERALYVLLRSDILAIDADTMEAVCALDRFHAELVQAGASPVLVDSGNRLHLVRRRHLLARVPDRRERERLVGRARSLGLEVRKAIRPPCTPHRLGGRSVLLSPDNPFAALVALAPLSAPPRRIDRKLRRLIPEAHKPNGRYSKVGGALNRSKVLVAFLLTCVNARWTDEGIVDFLNRQEPGSPLLEKLRSLPQHRRHQYLKRALVRAREKARRSPAHGNRPEVDAVIERAKERLLAIRSQHRASGLFVAARMFLEMARAAGTTRPHISSRRLAERLNVNFRTAARWLKEMQGVGLMTPARGGAGTWGKCDQSHSPEDPFVKDTSVKPTGRHYPRRP